MKNILKKLLIRLIPKRLRRFLADSELQARYGAWTWGRFSYAQEGEDIVLERFFSGQSKGYYIDLGCHHPARFSNTYTLYQRGWRGLNVDAKPGIAALFAQWRPEDITLEAGLAAEAGELVFFEFEETALNTFSADLAKERQSAGWPLVAERRVPVRSLGDILDQYWPAQRPIDLLSIDIEGMDELVLASNDWQKYRPRVLVVEMMSPNLEALLQDPIYLFLKNQGYRFLAKTGLSVFFTHVNSIENE